ncbi:hypothetical protein [Actinacidiphila epipremni]|uniref:Uncharacterized protein n=1 Tax=Actinacidiphila epipremni TaxID=2053013 RepID=A0ABX0ZEY2_9ACTN|nr:hypothetical protein [Actinacidiphila epipremni]NJP41871.1 hypothetical protein [Actinacidiphila epipremni]
MSGGAVAAGEGARAVDAGARTGDGTAELIAAVRVLRAELSGLAAAPGVVELDAELAGVEAEIAGGGGVDRGRLGRLRERLEVGATAAAGLASAAAVAQACVQLLG